MLNVAHRAWIRSRTLTRYLVVVVLAAFFVCLSSSRTYAHPLGNSSVTHFSILRLDCDRLELDLVLDIAETPAAVLIRDEIDADRDGQASAAEQEAWLNRMADGLAGMLRIRLDGTPLPLHPVEPGEHSGDRPPRLIVETPGTAGQPTYRLAIRYAADWPAPLTDRPYTFEYEDATFPKHVGLMRILLDRASVGTRIPTERIDFAELDAGRVADLLGQLLNRYNVALTETARLSVDTVGRQWSLDDPPNHLVLEKIGEELCVFRLPRVIVDSPRPPYRDECEGNPFLYEEYDPSDLPVERRATFSFHVQQPPRPSTQASPSAAAPDLGDRPDYLTILNDPRNDPSKQSPARRDADRLIALLQQPWGLAVFWTVTALCFVWGAAHALMPGHAKTLVAAYLISRHGSWWHAVVLAVVVTFTHTALVVILGIILWVYQRTHPQLGPTLQLWLGGIAGLLVAAMGLRLLGQGFRGQHAHTHSHPHPHPHEHHHDHEHPHNHGPETVTIPLLLMLGITGGIVPCPTATIIMLLGIGANVILGALYAVGIFSLGLALTLMAVGFAALSSRHIAARLMSGAGHDPHLSHASQWLLNRLLPAGSGLAVLVLGAVIAAHYFYLLRMGTPLLTWLK